MDPKYAIRYTTTSTGAVARRASLVEGRKFAQNSNLPDLDVVMTECLSCLTVHRLAENSIGGYYDKGKLVSTPEGPKAIADALLVNGASDKK